MKILGEIWWLRGDQASRKPFEPRDLAFIFFLLFLFFLPLYEAPKNIFSVLFLLFGVLAIFFENKTMLSVSNKKWIRWAFLLVTISPFFAGMDSQYLDFSQRFSNALNWALMPLVGFILFSLCFSKNQLLLALRVFSFGTVFSVVHAFYAWSGTYPELNSVGHVNQSSLYLAFSLIMAGFPVSFPLLD